MGSSANQTQRGNLVLQNETNSEISNQLYVSEYASQRSNN